jgi:hypothetical protein
LNEHQFGNFRFVIHSSTVKQCFFPSVFAAGFETFVYSNSTAECPIIAFVLNRFAVFGSAATVVPERVNAPKTPSAPVSNQALDGIFIHTTRSFGIAVSRITFLNGTFPRASESTSCSAWTITT